MESTLPVAVKRLKALAPEERERLLRRAEFGAGDVESVVREIVEDVRAHGDAAIRKYTEQHDGARPEHLEASQEEFQEAARLIDPDLMRALEVVHGNIFRFHSSQLQPQSVVETGAGIRIWREWRAIDKVGLYVPGGSAVYPSTVLMNAVPARVAGCKEIVLCSPPTREGKLPPAILCAAKLAGVSRVFKVGGSQAIAAMTYGTESVPRAYKIFGAGNPYVVAAKMRVFGDVDIDLPAGPSEIVILADDSANPTAMAYDLMAQSEHRPDSASVLVTTSTGLAERVASEIARLVGTLPTSDRIERSLASYGGLLVVDSPEEAAEFVNEYAPEHLEIVAEDPRAVLSRIDNAGSIFLGPYSPVACGDYATGGSHVLPTGQHARTFGPLSVEDFGRWVQVQEVTREGLRTVGDTVVTMATAEGLPAHALSIQTRFEE